MLTFAVAQYPISEHKNFAAWTLHMQNWVQEATHQKAELLVFPEYGAMELVSFLPEDVKAHLQQQIHELQTLKNDFLTVFSDLACRYQTIIVAPSFPVLENGLTVNRAYVFSPKGLAGYQDKFFMTRFEDEEWGIQSAAKQLSLFEADWGSFGIQICYDVEFGMGAQMLCTSGASLIVAPSCTETIRGATRVHIGARARALENQAYVAVAQTVGNALWSPAVDINYGFAAVYSTPDRGFPEEGILATGTPQKPQWIVQTLDFSLLDGVRKEGQVFNFKDQQRILGLWKDEEVKVLNKII